MPKYKFKMYFFVLLSLKYVFGHNCILNWVKLSRTISTFTESRAQHQQRQGQGFDSQLMHECSGWRWMFVRWRWCFSCCCLVCDSRCSSSVCSGSGLMFLKLYFESFFYCDVILQQERCIAFLQVIFQPQMLHWHWWVESL